ncbi:MAG: hypothetical protein K2N78_06105, partial [Oscillospiraceae bacterium]|nr:hypothetical protein [Oscillospiraceae bacterium]
MANKMKIASGAVKGALGCVTFGCGIVINSAFKAATGGFGLPSGSGSPVDEAKELSKYWFEEALSPWGVGGGCFLDLHRR